MDTVGGHASVGHLRRQSERIRPLVILSELRDYLKANRRATLMDMAHHFDTDPDALRGMIGKWMVKGRVGKLAQDSASCRSCCKCDPATTEIYEWKG